MAAVNWPSSKAQKIDLPLCFNNTLGYVGISRRSLWGGRFASCVSSHFKKSSHRVQVCVSSSVVRAV